jgi:hypothetical protein
VTSSNDEALELIRAMSAERRAHPVLYVEDEQIQGGPRA